MELDKWAKQTLFLWILGLAASFAVMYWILAFGITSLNVSLIIFFGTAKFLGGLGVVIGILSLSIIVLDKFPQTFQGKENRGNLRFFYYIMILLPLSLLIYGGYKVGASYLLGKSVNTLFDSILFLMGIISLLLTMYIIPIYKDKFESVVIATTGDMLRSAFKDSSRSIKKRFYLLRKDYAHAQMQDQMKMKDQLDLWRRRVAALLLIFLGVGSFVFTPIFTIIIVFWFRIYFSNAKALFKYEKYLLLLALGAVLVLVSLFPFVIELTTFYQQIKQYYYVLELCHFLGVLFGCFAYFDKFLSTSFRAYRLKAKEEEIKDLKKREKEYRKELKKLKKAKDNSE